MNVESKNIVFYDGTCPMCNRWVKWLKKRDLNKQLDFKSLHLSQNLSELQNRKIEIKPNTLIFIQENRTFYYSTAVIEILKAINQLWFMRLIWQLTPLFISDFIYHRIAKNRKTAIVCELNVK